MDLTTKTKYKLYRGITGTGQDSLIDALIPQVSAGIAKWLRRDLVVTTYKSWINGEGSPLLRLPNWPILAIYRVALGSQVVGRIENTATGTMAATVSFDGTNLTLSSVNSSGTETNTDLPVATYKVMSTLETAIEAVSGWECTLDSTDYESEPSSLLMPSYSGDALSPSTADLVLPGDPIQVKKFSDDALEMCSGSGGFEAGDVLFPEIGPDSLPCFPRGTANIFVWYKAGYTLPTDAVAGTLPDGLLLLVHQILSDVISSRDKNSVLQSESLGDYSYSLGKTTAGAIASAIESRKRELAMYRKVTI